MVQVGCPASPGEPNWGSANDGIAMANIIAAITNATVNNARTRFMCMLHLPSANDGRDS
jgi:hypothetical protein